MERKSGHAGTLRNNVLEDLEGIERGGGEHRAHGRLKHSKQYKDGWMY